MNNRGLQLPGRRNQLCVSARTARAAKNGDLTRAIQHFCGFGELIVRWTKSRGAILNAERKRWRGTRAQRHIPWDHYHRNAVPGNRRAHGDAQHARHLLRLRNQFAVVTAILEQLLRMRFLKVAAANFTTGNLRRNSQHRHAAAMTIVKAVDEMKIAGSATARAYG
jgi:hypothetical protein